MSKWPSLVRDKVEAYVVNTMQEERKLELLDNLSIAVEQLQNEVDKNLAVAIHDGGVLKNLCDSLSDILHHGLKDKLAATAKGKTSFWPVIEKMCLKEEIQTIYRLPITQSESNRCHAWMRMALKEHTIGSYLGMLLDDTKLLRDSYQYFAFMRDPVKVESVKTLFQYVVSAVEFDIDVELLDNELKESRDAVGSPSGITAMREATPSPKPMKSTRKKGSRKKAKSGSSKIAHIKDEQGTPDYGSGRSSVSSQSSTQFVDSSKSSTHEIKTDSPSSQAGILSPNSTSEDSFSSQHEKENDTKFEEHCGADSHIFVEKEVVDSGIREQGSQHVDNPGIVSTKSDSACNITSDAVQNKNLSQQAIPGPGSAFRVYKGTSSGSSFNGQKNDSSEILVTAGVTTTLSESIDDHAVDHLVKETTVITAPKPSYSELPSDKTVDILQQERTVKEHDLLTSSNLNERLQVCSTVDEVVIASNLDDIAPVPTTGKETGVSVPVPNEVNVVENAMPLSNCVGRDQNGIDTESADKDLISFTAMVEFSVDSISASQDVSVDSSKCESVIAQNLSTLPNGEKQSPVPQTTENNTVSETSNMEDSAQMPNNMDSVSNPVFNHFSNEEINTSQTGAMQSMTDDEKPHPRVSETKGIFQSNNKETSAPVPNALKNDNNDSNKKINDSPSMDYAVFDGFSERTNQKQDKYTPDNSPNLTGVKAPKFVGASAYVSSGISPVEGFSEHVPESNNGEFIKSKAQSIVSERTSKGKSNRSSNTAPRSVARSVTVANSLNSTSNAIESKLRRAGSYTARSLENHLFGALRRYSSVDSQRSSFDTSLGFFFDSGRYTTDSDSDSVSTVSTDSPEKQERERVRSMLADLGISDEILGLKEDHFATPDSFMGFTSKEELEHAIDSCKGLIKNMTEDSTDRRELINRLILLRIKLQEEKESNVHQDVRGKKVLGHQFSRELKSNNNHFCDCCGSAIWGIFQYSYKCSDCAYRCHKKCLPSVDKQCVSQKISETTYITEICPESGLGAQQYRCADCRRRLVCRDGSFECRMCDYTGQIYCSNCHWNEMMEIPARIIHNWDFTPRKVSRQSKHLLNLMVKKPIVCIKEMNPALFNFVEELRDVRILREQILVMKSYLTSCRLASEKRMLLVLKYRQHFVESADIYSLGDLIDVNSGWLLEELVRVHGIFAKHIKFDCILCQGKAFICEICKSKELIFPFDYHSVRCSICNATFHRNCFVKGNCPRCQRLALRRESETPK